MSTFWIIGIVVNVTLTVLAIYWIVKQMKPTEKKKSRKLTSRIFILVPGNKGSRI